jgi:T5SS/PEP-CTERM-associated repeat protein
MKYTCTLDRKAFFFLCTTVLSGIVATSSMAFDGITTNLTENDFFSDFEVGYDLPNTHVTISNGVVITASDSVAVGFNDDSTNNTLILEGAATLISGTTTFSTNTGGIIIGENGNENGAAFTINNASSAEANDLYMGAEADNTAKILVTGKGSELRILNDTSIGALGSDNEIDLRNGGTLSIGDNLYVGAGGTKGNSVNVNSGGTLFVNALEDIIIAVTSGGTNDVTISAEGTLHIGGDIDTSDFDSHDIKIKSGAKLAVDQTFTAKGDSIENGLNVILNTSNATWNITNPGESSSTIGGTSSKNSLTLTNGAATTIANQLVLGEDANADKNKVNVYGGSTLTLQTSMTVGGFGSSNELNVETGRVEVATNLTAGKNDGSTGNQININTNGVLNVGNNVVVGKKGKDNTFTISDGQVNVANDFILGESSANNRYLHTGGTNVVDRSTNTVAGSFIIGKTEDATGATGDVDDDIVETTGNLAIVGEGAVLNIQQNLTVGQEGGGSILTVRDGGTVNIAGDAVIGEAVEDNYIYLQRGSNTLFNVAGDLVVGKEGGSNRFAAYGGTANIDGNLYLGNSTNQHEIKNFIHIETTNAVLNVAKAMYIGASNSANTLDLVAGAEVNVGDLYVGTYEGTSNNVVTVTGDDSLLSVSTNLTIGSNTGSNNSVNVDSGGTLFVGGDINIIEAATNFNNRLNINSEGTLQTLDWDFATISSNILLNSGSTLEVGRTLSGTNLVDGGIEIALNGTLAATNAVWDTGTDILYVGYETDGNTLTVKDGGLATTSTNLIVGNSLKSTGNTLSITGLTARVSVGNNLIIGNKDSSENTLNILGGGEATVNEDLVIGLDTNSVNNLAQVSGSNSMMNIGHDLIVGDLGGGSILNITNGATVSVVNNAWLGLASSNNVVDVSGTNSSFTVENDLFVGSTNDASSGNLLGAYDTANIFVGGTLSLVNGDLQITYDSQVKVAEYEQDKFSSLFVSISTNSISTNLIVKGTANFEKDTTIAVINDGTIPDTLVTDGVTNKVGRTIVAAGSLKIDDQDATTSLLHNSIDFQLNSLLSFNYTVTNNTIFLDNFIQKSIADAAGLEGMLADVADEIDAMAVASNEFAQSMVKTFQDGMTDAEINKAMHDYYGEKESSVPLHNVVNQGLGGIASELTVRGDNTRERMGTASASINWDKPNGVAGPHMQDQELQGWISGYGSWGDKSAADGFDAYDSSLSGFIIGADLSVSENILVGLAGGSNRGSVDKDNGATGDSKTTYGAVYASAGTKDWFLDGSMIYGSSTIDQKLGDLFDTTADYDAKNFAFYLGGGKEITGDYLIITPQASLLVNYYDQDAYEEKSTDAVTRSVDGFDALYTQSSLGCNLGFYMGMGEVTLKPELRAHWLHEFNASEESLPYRLVGGDGSSYNMLLQAPEEDVLKLGAGISANLSEYLEIRLDLDTQQASDYSDYTVAGSFRYQF